MSTARRRLELGPLVDLGLALLVIGFSLAEVLSGQVPGPRWAAVATCFGFGLPLVVRRRWPWAVLFVVYGMLVVCVLLDVSTYQYMGSVIGCVVALGTLSARVELVPSLCGLGASYAVLLLTALQDPGGWLWGGFIVGAVWVGGRMLRQHRVLIETLRRTTAELEASRALAAEAAATQERARLARELHDVVAHSVSVMVVQAGAAERMVTLDPGRAVGAIARVQTSGREALVELRRLLGVLRAEAPAGSPDEPLSPQPDLDDLDGLVVQLRETGLRVTLSRTGDVRRLGPGVELAAYRILQEALTNVLKHARARSALVSVEYGTDSLELSVLDDGSGTATPVVPGSGSGVRGMSERAAVFGGTLHAGPRAGGGYAVRASLPLSPTSTVSPVVPT